MLLKPSVLTSLLLEQCAPFYLRIESALILCEAQKCLCKAHDCHPSGDHGHPRGDNQTLLYISILKV